MQERIKDILDLLDAKRLKEALVQLYAICPQANDWELRNAIEELQTSYNYMLQYAAQGMQDPNKAALHMQMMRTAYELTERTGFILSGRKRNVTLEYAPMQMQLEAYTEDMGTTELLYRNPEQRETETEKICAKHDRALTSLFEKIRGSIQWSASEAETVQQMMDSILIEPNDKAVIVSAVMMNLMHLFDERKFQFLMKAYRHEDIQVSQRALTGLIIVTNLYRKRLAIYPNITAQLSLLNDDKDFCKHLFTQQMQLLMTRETPKIDKKMREEIIPEMMKNPQLKKGHISFDENEEPEDRNPEWEEWMDKSGIGKKIREIGEMQMEGADVYMSTFFMLKSYPFFKETAHWFYPFDLNHPDLLTLKKEFGDTPYSPFRIVLSSNTFCNSDKYSFCLAINQMPAQMKEMNISQLQNQLEMNDERKSMMDEMMSKPKEAKNISRQYLQDLYRFVKIWRMTHAGEERDFLNSSYAIWEDPWIGISLQEEDKQKEMAEFLFQKGHLEEAYGLFDSLCRNKAGTSETYQKMGYIQQKLKNYEKAIAHYEHADILTPDNVWTLKHLAQCHKLNKEYGKALEYYRLVESIQPDNLNIAMQTGQCLVEQDKPEEALPLFYKVEYLSKNPLQAKRAIAWCSFLTGKYEEALKYYQDILKEEKPQMQDYLNCGHVWLLMGRTSEALKHYNQAQESFKNHDEFLNLFEKDMELLTRRGIAKEDIYIVLDLLVKV